MTSEPTSPVLCVNDLSASVARKQPYDIVRSLSLTLDAGDVYGLVGESGSGKTTTALAMLGYARPGITLNGSVRIAGQEMVDTSEADRRAARGRLVAYVPQDPGTALNPALRIGRQLDEAIAPRRRDRHSGDRERIDTLLDKVRLPSTREFLRRFPHQLSGGQLQRVCIAMALVNRPRLIVFDEPTTGLDVTTQRHVLDTIRGVITSEQAAALYVTHDLAVVSELANRVGVMYSGMLVEEAAAADVLHRSAHPYTQHLVLATPSVTQREELVGIPGTPLSPRDRKEACPFAPRCKYAEPDCTQAVPGLLPVRIDHWSRCRRSALVQTETGRARRSSGRGAWHQETTAPEAAPGALLSVSGLDASYGQHPVLHDVDLTVPLGACVALVGESGSGKTTLARCVSGIHPQPVSGALTFAGLPLAWGAAGRPQTARQAIQYIFQNPYASLNPRLTIGRIVAQPLDTFSLEPGSAARRERLRELLERVSLPADYEHRYPNQLSGGERQRVAIARALAAEPQLLVCDEITSSLDVSIQASILELLGQLRTDTNLTMLFITHHLGLVRAIADQVVILRGGRVVERGAATEVLDRPAEPYTIELLADTPSLSEIGFSSSH